MSETTLNFNTINSKNQGPQHQAVLNTNRNTCNKMLLSFIYLFHIYFTNIKKKSLGNKNETTEDNQNEKLEQLESSSQIEIGIMNEVKKLIK